MVRSLVALSGTVAVALLLASSVTGPAVARSGYHSGGHSYSGGHSHSGGYSARSYSPGPGSAGSSRSYGNYSSGKSGNYGSGKSGNYSYGKSGNYGYGKSGNYDHGRRHHGRTHRRVFIYGAYPYYDYDGGSCYWLWRRARATGSSYWWSRYEACVAGYDGY